MTPHDTFELAICYYEGKDGYEHDYTKAYPLFLEAAEAGHVGAQSYVGRMLCMAEGVKQNYDEAIKWLKLAAEAGDADAQNRLGVRYDRGEGVEKDIKAARYWYTKAGEAGHIKAMRNMSVLTLSEDKEESYRWLTAAAEAGDTTSMTRLGVFYYKDKELEKSISWFEKAVEADSPVAMTNLAEIYIRKAKTQKAYLLLRKAALKGSKKARRKLTDLYNGTRNFDVNINEHLRLLYIWKDLHSLLSLAYFTMKGIGMTADAFEAVRMWKRVHQQGYKIANYNLAVAHYHGIGVDLDEEKAKDYLNEIIDCDYQAAKMLDQIKENCVDKPSFHLYSPDIIPDSILEAETLTFSDRYAKSESIYKKSGTADSYFHLARYYKHDKDDTTLTDLIKSEECFEKAISLGHPYATFIKSFYKDSGKSYEDYDLYTPYYLSDIIESCCPKDCEFSVWDIIHVFWNLIKPNNTLEDKLSDNNEVQKMRKELMALCKLKEHNSLIEECKEFIWNWLEKGKESSLKYPSKTFIDEINSQLMEAKSICFYEGLSLKFIKFIDKDKVYTYHAPNESRYILAHFLVDLMEINNLTIKQKKDPLTECDALLIFPELSFNQNLEHTLDKRTSSLKRAVRFILDNSQCEENSEIGENIASDPAPRRIIRRKKGEFDKSYTNNGVRITNVAEYKEVTKVQKQYFKRAIILTNKEFASSVCTDISVFRSRLLKGKHLESVLEFAKETFSDIETTTTLLSLNMEKKCSEISFAKNGKNVITDYDTVKSKRWVLCYEIYAHKCEEKEDMVDVMLSDIMTVRTSFDRGRREDKVRCLTNQDFHPTLLNAVSKRNRFTHLNGYPTSPVLKEYKGEHIFLKYLDGVRINIQTNDTYCYPDYGSYAITRKKDAPVTLEYLAYILLSKEISDHIANIVDKNGEFMVRELMYKKVSIHLSKTKQQEIVEKALKEERQRIDEGLKYNIVVLSENKELLDIVDNEAGLSRFAVDDTYDEISKSYIFNTTSELIDAFIVDVDSEEFEDIMEDFNEIRQKSIHVYIVADRKEISVAGKKKSAYFIDNKRIFHLSDEKSRKELILKMHEDLNSSNAAQAKIRNKYKSIFEAADALDKKYPDIGISKTVLRYIQTGCNIDDVDNASGPCGSFRNVCHKLLQLFISKRIIPDTTTFSRHPGTIPSLLESGSYYDKAGTKRTYVIHKSFMNNYLCKALEYFCKVTNEGVHGSQDSSRLGTAALNILMEFIVWFYENDILNNNLDLPPDQKNWEDITDELPSHKGKVYTVQSKQEGDKCYFYADNIHISDDKPLKAGMKVKIGSIGPEKIDNSERKKIDDKYMVFYTSKYDIL